MTRFVQDKRTGTVLPVKDDIAAMVLKDPDLAEVDGLRPPKAPKATKATKATKAAAKAEQPAGGDGGEASDGDNS